MKKCTDTFSTKFHQIRLKMEKEIKDKRDLFLKVLQEGTEKLEQEDYKTAEEHIQECRVILKDRKKLARELMVLDLYSEPVLKMEIRMDTGSLYLLALELIVRKHVRNF